MKRTLLGMLLVISVCQWAAAESFVWKAQRDNSVIYLGGTFHILRESDYPLPQEFDQAYKASAMVVFETDIGKLKEPAMQQKMLAKSMYTDGSNIAGHLSAMTYAELSDYCEANGIPLQVFSRLKPSMLMTTLTLMKLLNMGVTSQGVDQYFYDLANRDGKAVKGLETVEEQIDFISTMADGNEDEFVRYSLHDLKNIELEFKSLADAWRKGDVSKLDELLLADLKIRQPDLYRKLITNRNRHWLTIIDGWQKIPQTAFILVGAAHLAGPDGIIPALRKRGYKVDKL